MHAIDNRASSILSCSPPCEACSFDTEPAPVLWFNFSVHHSVFRTSARTTAEIAFDHSRIALQAGRIVGQDDPAGFNHVTAFSQGKGDARVLLDEQDCHSRTPKG